MSAEDNKLHGPSVVRVVPTDDAHRAALSDPNAEIVYVAIEEYEDGLCSWNICWRRPAKPGTPATEIKTFLTPVVWYYKGVNNV